ncbi:hypothetical protein [Maricaulis maris]|uniref:hypothetical protein n=1 Tax=Maricaulis maris TaxID=74318 RepID=UPI003A8E936D
MNSIIRTHVADVPHGQILDAALVRFGAYLDAEAESLEKLLALAGHVDVEKYLADLLDLHLEPGATLQDVRALLENALKTLETLAVRTRAIPTDFAPEAVVPPDFDAWVRWSGARLADICATLRHAVAA